MTGLAELAFCGAAVVACGVAVLLALTLPPRKRGHRIGRRRRRSKGSWNYARPADSEPDRPFARGQIRNNLNPGEKP